MAEREIQVILLADEGSIFAYNRESYDLSDFGGTVPAVGDLITYSGVRTGLDRNDMANRKVRQVIRRYFSPDRPNDRTLRIYLVVSSRPGTEEERSALGD